MNDGRDLRAIVLGTEESVNLIIHNNRSHTTIRPFNNKSQAVSN